MKALGIHVFAGGFTQGVRRVAEVTAQFETHNFGLETVRAMGIPTVNTETWEGWLDHKEYYEGCNFCFGNPRCTGFSCITSGLGPELHGPWSNQTQDVHDLCNFAVKADIDLIIWESVQQAFSVGRPMLDYLRDELFVPNGYRIAHLFINAASFNNAQSRRRYFFVAYRGKKNFNVTAPTFKKYHATIGDIIGHLEKRKTKPMKGRDTKYTGNCFMDLTPDEWNVVPIMPEGMCLNRLAGTMTEELGAVSKKYYDVWHERRSDMPFSLHCISRPRWDGRMPTIHSSTSRIIHPHLDRPLTIKEIALLMGWENIPVGPAPVPQIAKGVVPAIGEWLAQMVKLYLANEWGKEDYETKYNHHNGMWEGRACEPCQVEKTINMTHFAPAFREVPC